MFVYQRVWIELKTQKPVTAIPFRCGVDATPEKKQLDLRLVVSAHETINQSH